MRAATHGCGGESQIVLRAFTHSGKPNRSAGPANCHDSVGKTVNTVDTLNDTVNFAATLILHKSAHCLGLQLIDYCVACSYRLQSGQLLKAV
jgi:hypothetical protein